MCAVEVKFVYFFGGGRGKTFWYTDKVAKSPTDSTLSQKLPGSTDVICSDKEIKNIVGFQIVPNCKTEGIQESVNGVHFLRIEFEVLWCTNPFEYK